MNIFWLFQIMKSTGENNTVPITSPLTVTEINERKHRLER